MAKISVPLDVKNLLKKFDVLYIEDDVQLLENTRELFQFLFKKVYTAKDGEEALVLYKQYFEEYDKYIDLVISDIEMPYMNGIETSRKILELNKYQKIIITSGYDDKKYFIELINIGVDGFIQKPLLSQHINTVLADVCKKIEEERTLMQEVLLSESCKFNIEKRILTCEGLIVKLSEAEEKSLELLLKNRGSTFTALEIFDYVYDVEKVYTPDIIKSLIKRLRKKLPKDIIHNAPNRGYFIRKL